MDIFKYGQLEIDYLKSRDDKLAEVIDRIGIIEREVTPDIFTAIVDCIISQQISSKASITICNRFRDKFGNPEPAVISIASPEDLRNCGLSIRKASYIKKIADDIVNGNLLLSDMHDLTDEEVANRLLSIKGIGLWTVEMLLIFSLQRPNIFSRYDYGISRGLMKLYGMDKLTDDDFNTIKDRYSPYGTIASFYLWEIL